MKPINSLIALVLILAQYPVLAGDAKSELIETASSELVLFQEVVINKSINHVWKAYTTSEGYMSWAAPVAKVDFRVGGEILTNYVPGAKIGDEGTNRVKIINYVPYKLLTIQAEVSDNWPEVLKADADHLMNVIYFNPIDDNTTKIESYGVGYRNKEAHSKLMKFFIPANEQLLNKLKITLENNE